MEEDREIHCHDCEAIFLLNAGDFVRYSSSGVDICLLTCQNCKSALRSSVAVEPENVASPIELLQKRIPGLQLLHDFVSQEEEAEIMREIDDDFSSGCEWTEEMSRRVKHFGFPFNYRTLMLDFCRETSPFTTSTASLARKIEGEAMNWAIRESQRYFEARQLTSIMSPSHLDLPLTQMTANEYMAGQGIAPHTDTTTCFGPQIFILSCNAGITMTFRRNKKTDNEASVDGSSKLSLWLPRRSLLIMSGESRFEWTHSIASRKLDNVNGELIQRKRRVSLTFRQALIPGETPRECLASSEIERDHVFDVYDTIALHWHHTRGKRKVHWHRVKDFILSIPSGSLVADVGSGDGKYFGLNDSVFPIGCDRSWNLLQVSRCASNETFCCDAVKLPYRSDAFDATICIAVLHHIGSVDRRVALIRELLRITRPGGSILLQAWALEQEDCSRRQFDKQDVFVPWRLQKQFQCNVQTEIETESESGKNIAVNCSAAVSAQDQEGKEGSSEDTISGLKIRKKKDKKNRKKKDQHHEEQLGAAKAKPYRVVGESIDEAVVPGAKSDGNADLITYERYCHMYRKGELENLCSVIPCCKIVESGWDKSNWFVQLMKTHDPRIVIKGDSRISSSIGDDRDAGKGDAEETKAQVVEAAPYNAIGIGVPQPMPVINLRTL